ncbi:hypothetical protein NLK93_27200, partial [Klebsiella pneumoniae]|uniref:hypothetical protein n=1 Tax=Klebsiella pneumoniae TaxID=573 RepID=UPI0021CFBC8A
NGGKNSLNRLIRCVCGKKIGPDPRNFNQRVSLGRNDLLIRTFPKHPDETLYCKMMEVADKLNAVVVDEDDQNQNQNHKYLLPSALMNPS